MKLFMFLLLTSILLFVSASTALADEPILYKGTIARGVELTITSADPADVQSVANNGRTVSITVEDNESHQNAQTKFPLDSNLLSNTPYSATTRGKIDDVEMLKDDGPASPSAGAFLKDQFPLRVVALGSRQLFMIGFNEKGHVEQYVEFSSMPGNSTIYGKPAMWRKPSTTDIPKYFWGFLQGLSGMSVH